jgi:hypothetical protein
MKRFGFGVFAAKDANYPKEKSTTDDTKIV